MTQTTQAGHAQTLPTETGIPYVRCFQPLSFAVLCYSTRLILSCIYLFLHVVLSLSSGSSLLQNNLALYRMHVPVQIPLTLRLNVKNNR